ncbi:MAG: TIGR04076 family protein [Acetatifactor sp.]
MKFTIIDPKGAKGCHRGHKIGDSFDFDTERGKLCPMAMHVAFPYVDILRYGGEIPDREKGTAFFVSYLTFCRIVDLSVTVCSARPDKQKGYTYSNDRWSI